MASIRNLQISWCDILNGLFGIIEVCSPDRPARRRIRIEYGHTTQRWRQGTEAFAYAEVRVWTDGWIRMRFEIAMCLGKGTPAPKVFGRGRPNTLGAGVQTPWVRASKPLGRRNRLRMIISSVYHVSFNHSVARGTLQGQTLVIYAWIQIGCMWEIIVIFAPHSTHWELWLIISTRKIIWPSNACLENMHNEKKGKCSRIPPPKYK